MASDLNLEHVTVYPDWSFSWFLDQPPQANNEMVPVKYLPTHHLS
jgi:hypothetical protein